MRGTIVELTVRLTMETWLNDENIRQRVFTALDDEFMVGQEDEEVSNVDVSVVKTEKA